MKILVYPKEQMYACEYCKITRYAASPMEAAKIHNFLGHDIIAEIEEVETNA